MKDNDKIKNKLYDLTSKILNENNETKFKETTLELFQIHASENPIYKKYIKEININPKKVQELSDIPFLPIEFFKSQRVLLPFLNTSSITFKSSGTTDINNAFHYIPFPEFYERSCLKGFENFFGKPQNYCILALLPHYLDMNDNNDSSIIYMIKTLMQEGKHPENSFHANNSKDFVDKLMRLDEEGENVLLFGVSFALLDLLSYAKFELKNTIIIETGGMKGKRKEITREELHTRLKKGYGVNNIVSEYGMAELQSQAYAMKEGLFKTPPWANIMIRDAYDPLSLEQYNKTGGINVIDLVNAFSCPFIATRDLGKKYEDGSFEVLGRFDNSDIRGCNLLVEP